MKKILILIFILYSHQSASEVISCNYQTGDGRNIIRTFERQEHYFYVKDEENPKYGGLGYKVIFDQDGFITVARGHDEISEICTINKKEDIFECTKLYLNKLFPIDKISGKCLQ